MPPKATSDAGAAPADYTESEIKLMVAIMELMNRPSLDYDALAVKLGSASANAARMRIAAAVGKHPTWFTGPAPAGATAATATNGNGTPVKNPQAKRTPKKNKAPLNEDDGNVEEQATPSRKKARTGKAKPAMKQELQDVADEAIKQVLKQEMADAKDVKQEGSDAMNGQI